MFETDKQVSKTLGLYYQNLELVVDTYVVDWFNKGYESDSLFFVANYCFKQSIRTLEGMNIIIQKFYKLGLVSLAAIDQYIDSILKSDAKIKEILDTVGLLRSVSSLDREFYKTWTNNWGFSHEQIILAAEYTKDKSSQMPYLNKILANLHEEGITDTKQIKEKLGQIKPDGRKSISKQIKQKDEIERRNYTAAELAGVVDSLDDVEL